MGSLGGLKGIFFLPHLFSALHIPASPGGWDGGGGVGAPLSNFLESSEGFIRQRAFGKFKSHNNEEAEMKGG